MYMKAFELCLVHISSSHYTICCLPCRPYINKWIFEISVLPMCIPSHLRKANFRNPNAIYMAARERDHISRISPGLVIFSHTTRFKVRTDICKMQYKPRLSVYSLPRMTNIAFGLTSLLLLAWSHFRVSVLQLRVCSIILFLGVYDKLKDVFISKV